jgi:hypothetical protein
VTSDYWGAVALTPAWYCLDAAGLNPIAARSDPEKAPSRQVESPPRMFEGQEGGESAVKLSNSRRTRPV